MLLRKFSAFTCDVFLNYDGIAEINTINHFDDLRDYQTNFKNQIEKYFIDCKGKLVY